jgi:hypothetical protein
MGNLKPTMKNGVILNASNVVLTLEIIGQKIKYMQSDSTSKTFIKTLAGDAQSLRMKKTFFGAEKIKK